MASSGWWTRLKENVGLQQEEPEPPTLLHQLEEATTLSRTHRVYGFAGSIAFALLFFALASFFFLSPSRFAILYTLANLSAIAATMFLMGPIKQVQKMFEKGRIFATIIYVAAMGATLWAALKVHSIILTLVFVIVQFFALIWYCMSYIPFARQLASKAVGNMLSG
ncbi:hypothetical protein WJX73_000663 [Symbiochloris irregularis]|uniref:Vesicle transport protein n=1 Tax=Symbiochloris irregularis TaxID=706552 RepID=A0AAW1NZ35_9CHLO